MSDNRCKKCVLSDSFPRIKFNSDGICNFCSGEILISTEQTAVNKAQKEIELLFKRTNSQVEYDAIMCFSGGKDSTYTLNLAVNKYRLRVLALTIDNGYLSPIAFENIVRVVESLGVDHLTLKPSSHIFNQIIKTVALNEVYPLATMRRISSGCNACISFINNSALRIALEKKIPFILSGFTLGQIPANSIVYQNNYEFLTESRHKILQTLRNHIGDCVENYFIIPDHLRPKDVQYPYTVNLLCLEKISEEDIFKRVQDLGWQKPVDVDGCSSNCRLNAFNNYVHQKRYGFSPYELELSHLIRSGLLTRQQAVAKLRDQPEEQISFVLNKLNISKKLLDELIDSSE